MLFILNCCHIWGPQEARGIFSLMLRRCTSVRYRTGCCIVVRGDAVMLSDHCCTIVYLCPLSLSACLSVCTSVDLYCCLSAVLSFVALGCLSSLVCVIILRIAHLVLKSSHFLVRVHSLVRAALAADGGLDSLGLTLNSGLVVTAVAEDSPAARAGVAKDFRLCDVAGEVLTGKSADEATSENT